jgi:hypothetical protein
VNNYIYTYAISYQRGVRAPPAVERLSKRARERESERTRGREAEKERKRARDREGQGETESDRESERQRMGAFPHACIMHTFRMHWYEEQRASKRASERASESEGDRAPVQKQARKSLGMRRSASAREYVLKR